MSDPIKIGLLAVFIAVLSGTAAWNQCCSHHIRNWKQCTWRNISSDIDVGLIRTCPFYKKKATSHLRVVWSGNLRQLYGGRCSRWYFTFNGRECYYPYPIDGVIYQSVTANILRIGAIEGHCGLIPAGIVSVEFRVGRCYGFGIPGDAYTGWNSYSRIIVEEFDAPQS